MSELRYGLELPDDPNPVWLDGPVTIGRHLDNDLVLGGEDVRDFHVRLEPNARGLRLIVLDGSAVHIGDIAVEGTYGLMPDDEIEIGRNVIRVMVDGTSGTCRWALHEPGAARGIAVGRRTLLGRADDCDIRIVEGHVSRRHATFFAIGRWLWVRDLGSSNGTFVNGERLAGACRLYHGDEVAFDQIRYQLIGDAPDLTPIRPPGGEPDQLPVEMPATADTSVSQSATVEIAAATSLELAVEQRPPTVAGPSLWGRMPPLDGHIERLKFGRQSIGRSRDADIVIDEPSVSLQHAEVDLNPDGTYLVNLISTNGTWVNGTEIHTRRLQPGDVVHFGRVRMDYLEPPSAAPRRTPARAWWIGLLILLGVAVLFLLH